MSEDKMGDLYTWMGFCLFMVQAAEHTLGEVLTVALPKSGVITADSLTTDTEEHRRKTIGQLVRKLNKRARIDPGIAARLESFLLQRNRFIHGFHNLFDLGSDAGVEQAITFCQELGTEAYHLDHLLTGVVFATFERIKGVTQGAVKIDWDSLPKDMAESLKKVVRAYPAIIREIKE